MHIPLIFWIMYNNIPSLNIGDKTSWTDTKEFIEISKDLESGGRTVCELGLLNISQDGPHNEYIELIPEGLQEKVTYEKFQYFAEYINLFRSKNDFTDEDMTEFFCNGLLKQLYEQQKSSQI